MILLARIALPPLLSQNKTKKPFQNEHKYKYASNAHDMISAIMCCLIFTLK